LLFAIYFVNFQKTRCRYSESGTEDHDWSSWDRDWGQMIQYRICHCCNL